MWWIVWSGWPQSHAGLSLKFHLWKWCDILAWRVWILLSTDHRFQWRSKIWRLFCKLTHFVSNVVVCPEIAPLVHCVLNPTSLKTFAEPQKGLLHLSCIFGRLCRSSWIESSGLAWCSKTLSAFLPSNAHQGWDVRQDWEPLHGCWFQCTADYPHQCFQDSVQMFCAAALCPNRRTIFQCTVHKSKASGVKSACTGSPAGAHELPDDVYTGLDLFCDPF